MLELTLPVNLCKNEQNYLSVLLPLDDREKLERTAFEHFTNALLIIIGVHIRWDLTIRVSIPRATANKLRKNEQDYPRISDTSKRPL